MKIFNTIETIKKEMGQQKIKGKSIGLVPTMGYLHDGHLSLIERAAAENSFIVVSIFVNPTQFGENEDFQKYPRNLEIDRQLAEKSGAHAIFSPSENEMYPEGYKTYVEVEQITDKLCGASRPGHFKGVTTVVAKLFNIIKPDKAYFGQKDAQQVIVIKQMVKDLNMNTDIVVCPIIREEDGLAMSSRNVYLSPDERKDALILSQSLFLAKETILSGERDKKAVISLIEENISKKHRVYVDYIEIVNADTLDSMDKISGETLVAVAVKIGNTRLIDNIIVSV